MSKPYPPMTLEEVIKALDTLPWEEAEVKNWDELSRWIAERLKAQEEESCNG